MRLTLAEAIVWICTRDLATVSAVAVPPANPALRAMRIYGAKVALREWATHTRVRLGEDQPQRSPAPEGGAGHATFQRALVGLTVATEGGHLPIVGYHLELKQYAAVPLVDIRRLRLKLDEKVPNTLGLWAPEGCFVWIDLTFALADLEQLWPVSDGPARPGAVKRIVDRIMAVSTNTQIKREDALNVAKGVDGFSSRRFLLAWRQVPAAHKVGRGKRGPNRKPVG